MHLDWIRSVDSGCRLVLLLELIGCEGLGREVEGSRVGWDDWEGLLDLKRREGWGVVVG